jgi:hypothetical protein
MRRHSGRVDAHVSTLAPCSVALRHPHLGDGESPVLLTQSQQNDYVVIEATDLRHAQAVQRGLKHESGNRYTGAHPANVLVALTVHVAIDARTALREIAEGSVDIDDSAHYVGTPAGLAGLIADMGRTRLADGVCLRLAMPESKEALRRIVDDVLPRLEATGAVQDDTAVDAVR